VISIESDTSTEFCILEKADTVEGCPREVGPFVTKISLIKRCAQPESGP
jgi:hypothetical protein